MNFVGIFKPKNSEKCYAKSNKPQCSLVDDLRRIQSSMQAAQSEYDRLKARKFYSPRMTQNEDAQKEAIWGMGILQLLASSPRSYDLFSLSRMMCPSLRDIMDAILTLSPENQLEFVRAYEAIAPTVKEMKARDAIIIELKAGIDELKDKESSLKQKLGIV